MPESNNPKRENLLNLALDATKQEREQSQDLNIGYNEQENTWDLIIRYSADLNQLRQEYPQITIVELLNGYAVVTLPQDLMEVFTNRTEIEYIEKPKRLFFAVDQGIRASCISPVQSSLFNLSGKGILCGLADSGIDWRHPDFCNADGTTRIAAIWDQTLKPDASRGLTSPAGYAGGVEFTREQINAALKEPPQAVVVESAVRQAWESEHWAGLSIISGQRYNACLQQETGRQTETGEQENGGGQTEAREQTEAVGRTEAREQTEAGGQTEVREQTETGGQTEAVERMETGGQTEAGEQEGSKEQTDSGQYVRLTGDSSGHGTHVAGIMAGNGRASNGRYRGVAYESDLIVVRLGTPRQDGFPSTVELMMAIDYMVRKARDWNLPLALNLSFGNNYGSHSGSSLIETYLNSLSGYWKNVISVGTGNEGTASIHTSGRVQMDETDGNKVQFVISTYETALSLQIWKSYSDEFDIQIVHPSGLPAGPLQQILGPQRFRLQQTEILLYYGEPSPYSPYQEIYIEFLPVRDYIDSGVWEIRMLPKRIVSGEFDMWLPGGGILNRGTGFLYPTEYTTLTIPSTADKVISVAAYNSRTNQAADFSGRGYTRVTNQIKPDLAAPGVGIVSAIPGGGYGVKSGTSMATPFVTGSAALLMQWGIAEGNDPYLYGEKVKAYLIKGARPLAAFGEYPNEQIGWGVLCLRDSIPV